MLFGNNIEYEDFEDYLLNGFTTWNINDLFDSEEDIKEARMNNFLGSYTFSIVYTKFKKVDYKFVFMDIIEDDPNFLRLVPIDLPDDKIFDYWITFDENGNPIETNENLEGYMEIRYNPYLKSTYQLEEDEMITFDGNISKIMPDDEFIIYNGLKYEVFELNLDQNGNPIKGINVDINEFCEAMNLSIEDLKNNGFKGKFERKFVRNTGEQYTEKYVIIEIDNDTVYLNIEDDAIPLSLNTPPILYREDNSMLIVQQLIAESFII